MKDVDFANISHPDQIAAFLRRCADQCYEAAGELTAAWMDKSAGDPWNIAAKELERAAAKIEDKI